MTRSDHFDAQAQRELSRWLSEEEGAQLRLEFEAQIKLLEAA